MVLDETNTNALSCQASFQIFETYSGIAYIYLLVFVLIYIADHFSHFDLVKGQWAAFSFSFNTFNIHASEENFIDDEIDLIPKTKGQILDQLASLGGFSGRIVNRVSINYASIWMKDKYVKEDN